MNWICLCCVGLLGFQAIPDALLRKLESTYPVPNEEIVSQCSGIIILGGVFKSAQLFKEHDQISIGEAAERATVPLGLLRKNPNLELVFSGGEGSLFKTGIGEAFVAKTFFERQGIDPKRIYLEADSRNTRENAQNTAKLLGKRCSETWLLVTSASHMPRSVSEFERSGIHVIPYPVDFQTTKTTDWNKYSIAESILRWQTALHEWVGIFVYKYTS